MGDLSVGIELLLSGLFAVFVILFIFRVIMDLMFAALKRFQKEPLYDLTEVELAAVMAVMKYMSPDLRKVSMKFTKK